MRTAAAYPSRLRARRRRARILFLSFSVVALLVISGSLVALAYLPQLSIASVEIKGLSTIPEEDMRTAIERELSSKYFFLLPKRNILFYPRASLESTLLSSFPKLRIAEITFSDLNRIRVEVEERSPLALWCGRSEQEGSACYFLDKDGFIYARAPEFSGTVFAKYYGGAGSESVGDSYLAPQQFRSLSALVQELGRHVGEPASVVVEENNSEIHFLDGFSVFLSLDDKPEGIVERLTLALSAPPLKGIDLSALSYIDLRFGDRVVYKFK